MNFKTVEWKNNRVVLIDQRKLPTEEIYLEYNDYKTLSHAIKDMVVRGAPAIGVTAAMAVALGSLELKAKDLNQFKNEMNTICDYIISMRPTAVNLPWAVKRMQGVYQQEQDSSISNLQNKLIEEAQRIFDEDIKLCVQMGQHGANLIQDGDTILTHCNAGALATAGQGTALSVIYEAAKQGKKIKVFADETRPFLQGARLTAWELKRNGIDVTLIPDVAAASLMRDGLIQKVVVGADRITAHGNVANKIGTYSVALAAKAHQIPFYVAAPFSTIDWSIQERNEIPIEERPEDEVVCFWQVRTAPEGVQVRNPAFDVTPHELISGIVTEKGVAISPVHLNLKKLYE
ncbi:MAG: S-methyl-5-thioribose-1-phosphate isomerase [Deltaproteobacteria bacterium]|nr:S-methyl-5-thioribose-1-phosphate isomerase [Deltaproteobacteria bacterium]